MILTLNSSVESVKGVGETYLSLLAKNGIATVSDLLLHFPISYLNFKSSSNRAKLNERGIFRIVVTRWRLSRLYAKRLSILKIWASLGKETIVITIFNKPYLQDFLRRAKEFYIFGTIQEDQKSMICRNPALFVYPQKEDVVPIYSPISTIKSGRLKQLIKNALQALQDNREDLPPQIVNKYSFPAISATLKNIHFPPPHLLEKMEILKKRFIYQELLQFQLELQFVRSSFKEAKRSHHFPINEALRQAMKRNLKFTLTRDQLAAFEDIVNDLKGPTTMRRLIQGEVGSGKTIVAFLALLVAVNGQCQGALLAPTEVLATQHFQQACQFFQQTKVELLTGSTPPPQKAEIKERLSKGDIDILIGTHAILQQKLQFKNIGLIVIDEQHKFGVAQRASLYYKGKALDVLVTTATPIPRTMMLSLYNDLSVSTIKTRPAGRLAVDTQIIQNKNRESFYQELKKNILQGNKAFIVLPLIEDSEFFPELKSIKGESQHLKGIFSPLKTAIISSRSPIHQRARAIDRFRRGEIQIIISTTVIEIGIDIPDATIMIIENADRYGLAQLHQLRGRVGRSDKPSSCYLIPSANISTSGQERLQTLVSTEDGFKIAEKDLQMRGGGIITGLEQSGFFDFKVANLKTDHEQLKLAQMDAAQILAVKSWQRGFVPSFLKSIRDKLKHISFS